MHPAYISLVVIAVIILLIVILKIYVKCSTGWDRSPTCLVGKTTIVTGSNTGIGYFTALDFAKRGARVILACRDPIKAEEAKNKIIEETGNLNVVVRILNLSSLPSVRKFVVETIAIEKRLDILVNNAGAGFSEPKLSVDGFNLIVQINYLGPFLLTILLLDLLKKSAPSRIVNVSSVAPLIAKFDVNDLNAVPKGVLSRFNDYGNTKLCNILFTVELAKRLKGTGVDTNCLHPGVVASEFFRSLSFALKVINSMLTIFHKTSEEGAQTSIYVAVSKEISGISGEYFADCKKSKIPKSWRNQELAKQLWSKTEMTLNLSEDEKI